MYEILLILILILSILYTIDNKPLNIVIDFILIIINISILLFYIDILDISFFSFILIIIYASALAILFGLIMMLFNNIYNSYPLAKQSEPVTLTSITIESLPVNSIPSLSEGIQSKPLGSKNFLIPLKLILNLSPFSKVGYENENNKLRFFNLSLLRSLLGSKEIKIIFILFFFLCLSYIIYKLIPSIYNNIYYYIEGINKSNVCEIRSASEANSASQANKDYLLINNQDIAYYIQQQKNIDTSDVVSSGSNFFLLKPLNIDLIKIIFMEIYTKNYINIILIIIILLISLIGIIYLLI